MTTTSVLQATNSGNERHLLAIVGKRKSFGRTAGEALDALIAQEAGTIDSSAVLIHRFAPDAYFAQDRYERMQELLDSRASLSASESGELDALSDEELDATILRTDSLVGRLQP